MKTLFRYELVESGELIKTEIAIYHISSTLISYHEFDNIIEVSISSLDKCVNGIVYSYNDDIKQAARLLEDYHIEQCDLSMKVHKNHLNILLNYYRLDNQST